MYRPHGIKNPCLKSDAAAIVPANPRDLDTAADDTEVMEVEAPPGNWSGVHGRSIQIHLPLFLRPMLLSPF